VRPFSSPKSARELIFVPLCSQNGHEVLVGNLEGGRSSLWNGESTQRVLLLLSPSEFFFVSRSHFSVCLSSSLSSLEDYLLPSSTVSSLLPFPFLLVASNRADSRVRLIVSLSVFAEKMLERYGMQGSCAMYCRTQCCMVNRIPDTMSFEEACCMPSCMRASKFVLSPFFDLSYVLSLSLTPSPPFIRPSTSGPGPT